MSDVEVDLEILNQVDQEHQISQNLGDAISERLSSVMKKHWPYEPEKFDNIKKLHEQLLIPQNCGENAPLSWIGRFSATAASQQTFVLMKTS